ncbi:site-specific recombinase [Pseudoduganella sp.]|uniref:site-specific recombinase n=1 Tax=Pseudoduganella sp. TaxID=1880898 RepID=UPI0035B3FFDA
MMMDSILTRIQASASSRDTSLLQELVDTVRPTHASDLQQATNRLRALAHLLATHPEWAQALRNYLAGIIGQRKLVHLLTDTGILQNQGFFGELWRRLNHKWLPPTVNDDYLKDVFGLVFHRPDDYRWVNGVDPAVWLDLLRALDLPQRGWLREHGLGELLEAVQVLSYRISAIGLEPELVRVHPDIERFESPFLRQNAEVVQFTEAWRARLVEPDAEVPDARHIDVLLDQCEEIIGRAKRTASVQGVSVSLTRLLLRLTQSIERLRAILDLVEAPSTDAALPGALDLLRQLVEADNRKWSLSDLFQTNTELLALQVTEHAGRSGEHYVASTRGEWLSIMRSASGAGFIVGFMAMLKVLMASLVLAPIGYAVLYSLNYAFGFMLIHVLHFTVATKQPAMTAARIAAAINDGSKKLDELADLVVKVLRSQFVAIVGNVAIAMPTAFAIAVGWQFAFGSKLAGAEKSLHLLHDIDPLHSLALPHAAIAGVCLFLAGLISGYYDNKAAYNDIAARLRQLAWLRRLLGEQRLARVTAYIGQNLGALAGNFFFGIMLGSIGTIGFVFGLPIDIRHVTFSSANFAFALVGLDYQLTTQQWVLSLTGIVLIALTNLAVSFSLALMVALRSRRISFGQGSALLGLVWQRFRQAPRSFFVPPREVDAGGEHA